MSTKNKPMRAGSAAWSRAVDRVVDRTAESISSGLDQMMRELPEDAAPQMAIELVVVRLAAHQPWLMQLIMEDADIRKSYTRAVTGARRATSS